MYIKCCSKLWLNKRLQPTLILRMSLKLSVIMIATLAIIFKYNAQTTETSNSESSEVEVMDLGNTIV